MGKNDKVRLPSSGAGITQYFEETRSKYEMSPMQVIIIAIAIIVVVMIMRIF